MSNVNCYAYVCMLDAVVRVAQRTNVITQSRNVITQSRNVITQSRNVVFYYQIYSTFIWFIVKKNIALLLHLCKENQMLYTYYMILPHEYRQTYINNINII